MAKSVSFPKRPLPDMYQLQPLMVEVYSDLSMYELFDPEDIQRNGGYHYIVVDGAFSHSAYRTKRGLDRFLKITGLKKSFDRHGDKIDMYTLHGSYTKISLAGTATDLDRLGKKRRMKATKILDNGRYTKAFYGRGKIYYLNPNYPRKEYPYFYE